MKLPETKLASASRVCPLCDGISIARSYTVNGYAVGPCTHCGLWRLEPQPTRQALTDYYQRDYYNSREWVQTVPWESVQALASGKMAAFFQTLQTLASLVSGRHLLDVGCAFGQFVWAAQQRGFQAAGVELDLLVAQRAAGFGFDVQAGDFLTMADNQMRYDVITLWYVLEHVVDPVQYLRRSYALLRPGGVLFVRVPNVEFALPFLRATPFGWRIYPSILSHIPAHLFFFSPRTLRASVESAGFDVLILNHGKPIFSEDAHVSGRVGNLVKRMLGTVCDMTAELSGGRILPGPYLSLYAQKPDNADV